MHKWIFKILRPSERQAAQNNSAFSGAAIDEADGFIHFSTADQIQETADKHFTDTTQIHVLAFAANAWPDDLLKWEKSRGGALFPHLYAPFDVCKSAKEWTFERSTNSKFNLFAVKEWVQKND